MPLKSTREFADKAWRYTHIQVYKNYSTWGWNYGKNKNHIPHFVTHQAR